MVVPSLQQHDPTALADAADTHHLPGEVHVLEALEQRAAVAGQRRPVRPQQLVDRAPRSARRDPSMSSSTVMIIGGSLTIRRRPSTTSDSFSTAFMLSRVRHFAAFFWSRLSAAGWTLSAMSAMASLTLRWAYQTSRLPISANSGHRFAVGADRRAHRRPARVVVEPVGPTGDLEARGQPLHVPLEGPRVRLVEVVDVEDQPPLGAAEHAEVGQVGVAAELHRQARGRGPRQVGGHEERPRRGRTRTARPACVRTGCRRARAPGPPTGSPGAPPDRAGRARARTRRGSDEGFRRGAIWPRSFRTSTDGCETLGSASQRTPFRASRSGEPIATGSDGVVLVDQTLRSRRPLGPADGATAGITVNR